MGKIIWIIGLVTLFLHAVERGNENGMLHANCLSCHQKEQIPSALIYKRYLMKYSTDARMEAAMFTYMKAPKKEYSIMPAPFFSKFPMKQKMPIKDEDLHRFIKRYLEKFDMKIKLVLEKEKQEAQ